jgi:hypothetical protein
VVNLVCSNGEQLLQRTVRTHHALMVLQALCNMWVEMNTWQDKEWSTSSAAMETNSCRGGANSSNGHQCDSWHIEQTKTLKP